MQLSTTTWNPVSIQVDAADRLDDATTGVATFRGSLVPRTGDAGSFIFKAWQGGRVVDEMRLVGHVSATERARLGAVRDALLGSEFLRHASVVTGIAPLPVGSLRITVVDAQGVSRAYTSRADQAPPASLQAVDSALESWAALAFPQMVERLSA